VKRDYLSVDDLSPEELGWLLDLSAKVKAQPGDWAESLRGKSVAMVFEKPSTRTRVSFEIAIASAGAHPVPLSSAELQLGRGETIEDTGRVLSRYVDAVVLRTFEQERLEVLAGAATVPVVNALSDFEHPCQALADFFTLWERGLDLRRLRLAWIGDGNNVSHSLIFLAGLLGAEMTMAVPPGFEPDARVVETARAWGGRVTVTGDVPDAARGADAIYTDVWTSMGQEAERDRRLEAFSRYQVNERVVGFAKPEAVVMHCLPAHRGEEITDAVLDGPQSVVLDQSENRLHVQKAVLLRLLGKS
jgi:ornithine carbamoyltransferase